MNNLKIISGFQCGSDEGGVEAARLAGIQTGGHIPKGYKTLEGPKPQYKQLYGAIEDDSPLYPPRTEKNVYNSDLTIRLAYNFNSAGEKCTLNAIQKYGKPHIDVNIMDFWKLGKKILKDPGYLPMMPDNAANHILSAGYSIVNIAGNCQYFYPGYTEFPNNVRDFVIWWVTEMLNYYRGAVNYESEENNSGIIM